LRARKHNRGVGNRAEIRNESAERAEWRKQELSEAERAEMRGQIERLAGGTSRPRRRDRSSQQRRRRRSVAMQRLKKRKLALRDRLAMLDDLSTPDIIA